MEQLLQCPLCGDKAASCTYNSHKEIQSVECVTCGHYDIHRLVLEDHLLSRDNQWALSAATRKANERDPKKPVTILADNLDNLAEEAWTTPLSTKRGLLVDYLAKQSRFFGQTLDLQVENDWPLFRAWGTQELIALLQHLKQSKLVDFTEISSLSKDVRAYADLRLTFAGWEAFSPAEGAAAGFGFIAMSFDPQMENAYSQGIRPALRACGFESIRVDKVHHNEKICDRIINEIRRSQFVIADVTIPRPNVYFEAGYALALGRTVIWSCSQSQQHGMQFDTRQYPHILWNTEDDLRVSLTERLRSTIRGAKLS